MVVERENEIKSLSLEKLNYCRGNRLESRKQNINRFLLIMLPIGDCDKDIRRAYSR